jgi:predicted enzyme related to lactoylglutathione lyase
MPISELFMVELRVTHRPPLVEWYAGRLGLKVSLDDSVGDFTLLTAGGTRLAIKGGRSETSAGSVALMFLVQDLDAEIQRVKGLGEEVSEIETSPEGFRAVRLVDPVGTSVQLFEWIKAGDRA